MFEQSRLRIKSLDRRFSEIRDSAVVMVGQTTLQVTNYAFHFVVARLLGPANYGLLVALLALAEPIPAGPLRQIFSQRMASTPVEQRPFVIRHSVWLALRWNAIYAVVLIVLLAIFARPLQSFLKLSGITPLIILLILLLVGQLVSFANGLVEGMERFKLLSLSMIVQGIGRLAFATALAGLGVVGALIASPISSVLSILTSGIPLFKVARRSGPDILPDFPPFLTYYFYLAISQPVSLLLIGIDVIMARRLLIPEHAGYFAALSTLGRITIYISGAVAVVLFPRLVRQLKKERHTSPVKILLPGLLLSLTISALVPVMFALFPKLIINVLYGLRYPGLEPILWVYAMALLPVVVVKIVSQYFLATRALAFPVLVGLAIAVKVVLLSLFHDSLLHMVLVVGIVNLSIAIILLMITVFASSLGREKAPVSTES